MISRRGLNSCVSNLSWWNKNVFGHVQKQLSAAHQTLERLQGKIDAAKLSLKKKTEQTIAVLHEKEEKMWRQRSRVAWLKDGDRNTRFFHERANTQTSEKSDSGNFL